MEQNQHQKKCLVVDQVLLLLQGDLADLGDVEVGVGWIPVGLTEETVLTVRLLTETLAGAGAGPRARPDQPPCPCVQLHLFGFNRLAQLDDFRGLNTHAMEVRWFTQFVCVSLGSKHHAQVVELLGRRHTV